MARIVLEKGDEAVERKVSEDGRVWGLTKYAGKKVTVIIHAEKKAEQKETK